MRCGDENELLAYAEGLLPRDRARAVATHVDACTACRVVLAGLVRGKKAPKDDAPLLPAGLVAQYLAKDAPNRELALSRFWAVVMSADGLYLAFVSSRAPWREAFTVGALIVMALVAYQISVVLLIRRGWFDRRVPVVSTLVEIGFFVTMNLHMTLSTPFVPRASPGPAFGVALVMFTAIRARPALSVCAGAIASAGYLLPFFLSGLTLGPGAPYPISFILLMSGVAAAITARYLVNRAEAALHEIREQDLFGKYILHEPLGTGGMGEVFRATYAPEGGFVRTVAVKRLRPEISGSPELQEHLREEARLSAQLSHPNLVQVLDCGTFKGSFVLAMEYVEGLPLSRLLRAAPLEVDLALFVAAELSAALAYAHDRRGPKGEPLLLVHCDVNPPNVMISAIGEIKLCDFGVARPMRPGGSNTFGGKARYAAPEQLAGGPLDGRADLFGLGLVLHEALTGTPAFSHEETALSAEAPRTRTLRPDVPEDVEALIADLLAKDRDRRPQNAGLVRARLLALLGRSPRREHAHAEALGALVRRLTDRA